MNKNFKDLESYKKWFEAGDELGKVLGAKMVSLSDECSVFEYNVRPEHYNPMKILHGGALFGVMDSSQGLFVHHILDPKFRSAVTGTATIKFSAPVTTGKISVTTRLEKTQDRKMFIASVATDDSGKEVARLDGLWIAVKY